MKMTHYQVLGVERNATTENIRDAYRRRVSELHPDRHPGDKEREEAMKAVTRAYAVLSDARRRAGYDHAMKGRPIKCETPGAEDETQGPPAPYHEPGHHPQAAVNLRPTMTHAEAMEKKSRRELRKAVLTEQGWVTAID